MERVIHEKSMTKLQSLMKRIFMLRVENIGYFAEAQKGYMYLFNALTYFKQMRSGAGLCNDLS